VYRYAVFPCNLTAHDSRTLARVLVLGPEEWKREK
jgi:hypothetical protein